MQAVANACGIQETLTSGLNESEVPQECEKKFGEDEELKQLVDGEICFKIYPFDDGMHYNFPFLSGPYLVSASI